MRFLERNLTKFSLYKARRKKDAHGDGVNVYDRPPVAEFRGNTQPAGESVNVEAYGIKREYAHLVYTPTDAGFCEKDRISDGARWYEIAAIKRWNSYLRLLVSEVWPNERH